MSDVTFDMKTDQMRVHFQKSEPWKVTLIDTGENTMTGGRLKRVREYLEKDTFCFTYGDGLSDINIDKLVKFHKSHKRIATLCCPTSGRYGSLDLHENKVTGFLKNQKVMVE